MCMQMHNSALLCNTIYLHTTHFVQYIWLPTNSPHNIYWTLHIGTLVSLEAWCVQVLFLIPFYGNGGEFERSFQFW